MIAGSTQNPHDGVALAYSVAGTGQPLLLLHGSGLSKATWRGLGYTRELQERFQVIGMDLRGHGRSGKPGTPDAYAMDTLVADALAVLDAVGVTRAHVGGYSVGARIGFSLAVHAPARLRSLCTLGGTYRILPGSVGELFFPAYDAALAQGGMPAFLAGWEERRGKPLDPQTRAAFLANDATALRAYFQRTEAEPALPEAALRALALPCLLLAGTRDTQRLNDSRRAAALIPGARFAELPGRSHATTLVPAADVLEHWLPFLAAQHG